MPQAVAARGGRRPNNFDRRAQLDQMLGSRLSGAAKWAKSVLAAGPTLRARATPRNLGRNICDREARAGPEFR
eukprot:6805933-Lingulodinium_polyedra.AAC.1